MRHRPLLELEAGVARPVDEYQHGAWKYGESSRFGNCFATLVRDTFKIVPLFWLNYRHSNGRAAGVVVIESAGLLHARLKAALAGADHELEFASGHQLDQESAEQIPANMMGRMLDDGDLGTLHRALVKKGPPAPSVRRRTAAKRRVGK